MVFAEPGISNANSKQRRSHNPAEPINYISKIAHCATSIPIGVMLVAQGGNDKAKSSIAAQYLTAAK
jgi:hypothetical protein